MDLLKSLKPFKALSMAIAMSMLLTFVGPMAGAAAKATSSQKMIKDPWAKPWGERLIQMTMAHMWTHLTGYMDHLEMNLSYPDMQTEEFKATAPIRIQMVKELIKIAALDISPFDIQFRDGNDPVFQLRPGEPPRTAVTGPELHAPIIFNKSIINNPDVFGADDALKLLVHELGHKISKPSQALLDDLANRLATNHRNWESTLTTKVINVPELKMKIGVLSAPPGRNFDRLPLFARIDDVSGWIRKAQEARVYGFMEDGKVIDLTSHVFEGFYFSTYGDKMIPYEKAMEALRDEKNQLRTTLYRKSSVFLEDVTARVEGRQLVLSIRGGSQRVPLYTNQYDVQASTRNSEVLRVQLDLTGGTVKTLASKYTLNNSNPEADVLAMSYTDKDETGRKKVYIKGQIRNEMKSTFVDMNATGQIYVKVRINEEEHVFPVEAEQFLQTAPAGGKNIFFDQVTAEELKNGQVINFEFKLDGRKFSSESIDITNVGLQIIPFGRERMFEVPHILDFPVVRFQPTNHNRCQSTFVNLEGE